MTVSVSQITRGASSAIAAWHLDLPKSGDHSGHYTLDLAGWAIAADPGNEVVAIALEHDGCRHVRIPIQTPRPDVVEVHPEAAAFENCGFQARIGLLGLPARCTASVVAIQRDESTQPLCTFELERPSLPVVPSDLGALITVCLGRSGTTRFSHLLSLHPEIAAYRPLQYETRVSRYWVDVLRALSIPDSFLRALDGESNERHWFLGGAGSNRRLPEEPELVDRIARVGVEELAAHAASQARALFRCVADADGAAPRYFNEKLPPEARSINLVDEVFAPARMIFLVRDFRDMFASVVAYNARKPKPGFGRALVDSDAEHARLLADHADVLAALHRRRDDALLVRYEDLVAAPAATLDRLFSALGIAECGAELVDAAEASGGKTNHRTTAKGRSTVGRWREDLGDELAAVVEEAFAGALAEFGYS